MKFRKLLLVAALTALAASVPLRAEMAVRDYLSAKANRNTDPVGWRTMQLYVTGLREGMWWAGAEASAGLRGHQPFLCPPAPFDKVPFDREMLLKVLDENITRFTVEQVRNDFISVVLMSGLEITFHCAEK